MYEMHVSHVQCVRVESPVGHRRTCSSSCGPQEELQVLRSQLDSEGLVEHTARKLRNRKLKRVTSTQIETFTHCIPHQHIHVHTYMHTFTHIHAHTHTHVYHRRG